MFAFWQSLFFVMAAEMGDKTQLVALAFATRFPAATVLSAIFAATLLVHLGSVAIGELLGFALPTLWINVLAGLAFIGFGIWTLRGDSLEDEATGEGRRGPFFTIAVTFFLAELGDKTMLTTVTLASQQQAFVPVWLGSSLGMVVADAAAILIGVVAGRKLPRRPIQLGAAAIFLGFGLWTIAAAIL